MLNNVQSECRIKYFELLLFNFRGRVSKVVLENVNDHKAGSRTYIRP